MSAPLVLPTLLGAQVRLRGFTAADLPAVREASTDPLIPLIGSVPAHGDDDACLAFVARQRERLTTGAGYAFAVADLETDVAVGHAYLGLRDLDHGRVSLGYWVVASRRGRGLARDALRTLAGWALTLPGVARLELYVEPWNVASARTALGAGFEREGLLRSWQAVGGERRDMEMYSRLRDSTPPERRG
ncbi:GNAT family N-acetyltransferase [Cellulomonas fengjieae]|uniref:GNAT family N-acetyltransferase n=1 Tax=Cellulomonas fengjieae TaxID=2819978 RepID=A0ABS3SL69_9CELL|nr:GNAT family protein [Cellulomonas fengjieae]MBO3086467.1 GNAT family N-acetyltransferase [Cellulomonas fengjieae]QVI66669.1 GNAT family N-acetyltransferase [Cellulomonas fengjieae]